MLFRSVVNALVDDFVDFERRDAEVQRARRNHFERIDFLTAHQSGEDAHEARAGIEVVSVDHGVERKVFQALDEFEIGCGQNALRVRNGLLTVGAGSVKGRLRLEQHGS